MPSRVKTKVGIGFCDLEDGLASGSRAAREAIESASIGRPDFVYAFCAGCLDHDAFFSGIREVVGKDVPIAGGSTIGIVTNHHLLYEGFPAAVAIIESEDIRHRVATTGDLDKGEEAAGIRLAELMATGPGDKGALLFFEWVRKAAKNGMPPLLNASSPLLDGLSRNMAPEISLAGAGMLGNYEIGPGKQFCGSHVGTQQAVGIVLSGNVSLDSIIMHGCSPLDGIYHRITKIEGSVIYELNGRPIAEIIDELFGNREWRGQTPVNYLTLGVNYGERYGDPRESDYVNRMMIGVLPDGNGVTLFEPDFEEGVEVQFMLRDTRKMVESAGENSMTLMERVVREGKKPLFALYIDCAGRTMGYSSSTAEESAEVQRTCNHYGIPLLGLFTGVEIAPLLGRPRGLDWTGVLVVIAEDP